jgi:hypothetical protein
MNNQFGEYWGISIFFRSGRSFHHAPCSLGCQGETVAVRQKQLLWKQIDTDGCGFRDASQKLLANADPAPAALKSLTSGGAGILTP